MEAELQAFALLASVFLWGIGILFAGGMLVAKLVRRDWEWVRRLLQAALLAVGGFYIFGSAVMSDETGGAALAHGGIIAFFGALCIWAGWAAFRE